MSKANLLGGEQTRWPSVPTIRITGTFRQPFCRPERRSPARAEVTPAIFSSTCTHRKPNWNLLLDKSQLESIYAEAQERIPKDFTQFLLLEKVYSTPKPRSGLPHPPTQPAPDGSRTLVVLREPDPIFTEQGDLVSHHLHEGEAIAAADTYARFNQRRAVVGSLVWDERWH